MQTWYVCGCIMMMSAYFTEDLHQSISLQVVLNSPFPKNLIRTNNTIIEIRNNRIITTVFINDSVIKNKTTSNSRTNIPCLEIISEHPGMTSAYLYQCTPLLVPWRSQWCEKIDSDRAHRDPLHKGFIRSYSEIPIDLIVMLIIQSGHKFTYATTAVLSWHM